MKSAELRFEALRILAKKQSVALRLETMCDRLSVKEDDLLDALAFLYDLGFVSREVDSLGSSVVYRATSNGVIFFERLSDRRSR